MSKIMRIAVLAMSLLSLFAAMSSTAGAVTWTNTGETAFHAVSTDTVTYSVTNTSLSCVGATASGNVAMDFGSTVIATATTGTMSFLGCRIAGIATVVSCEYALTAAAQPVANLTTGNADLTCNWSQGGVKRCHIEGSAPFDYINGHASGSGKGTLVFTATTTLRLTDAAPSTCPLPAGELLHWSRYHLSTTTAGPTIVRDA